MDISTVSVEEFSEELEIVRDIRSTASQHTPKACTSQASLSQFLVVDSLRLEAVYLCVCWPGNQKVPSSMPGYANLALLLFP